MLVQAFNKRLKSTKKKYRESAKSSISPSGIGSPCIRKGYYSYSKAPEECIKGLKLDRILDLGTVLGDYFVASFRDCPEIQVIDYYDSEGKAPIVFKKPCQEFPVTALDLGINYGFIDLVFINRGKLYLAEFKTINDRGFVSLKNPKDPHLFQSVLYIHIFNWKLKNGDYAHIKELKGFTQAQGIDIFYYNKNDSSPREFYYEDTKDVFQYVVAKIQKIRSVGKTKILPEKTKDWCENCAYAKRCKANEFSPRDGGLLEIKES